MAHMEKFSRGSVNGLSIHIERKTVTHSNKDIDPERSYLNYDLCQKSGDMNERLARRLKNVHCLNRENVKVMADWIVTLPETMKDSPREDQRIFFETTYTFLADRYGQENVLAGVVHNDETTPHMHFAFIPVTFDQKKQREKVSAKEVLNRKELLAFHKELDTYLKEHIPEIYTYGILNDKTIGVDDVGTLKKHGKQIKELKEELTSKTEDLFTQIEEKDQQETLLTNQLYATWYDDWKKTKDAHADFQLSIRREDYTSKRSGIEVVDEFTPQKLSLNIRGVLKLIQEKFSAFKEFLAEKTRILESKLNQLIKEREGTESYFNRLDEQITVLNDELPTKRILSQQLDQAIEAKTAYVQQLEKSSELSMAMPSYVRPSKLNKDILLVPKDKWEAKHVAANSVGAMMRLKDTLLQMNASIERQAPDRMELFATERSYKKLLAQKNELETENEAYRDGFLDLLHYDVITERTVNAMDLPAAMKRDLIAASTEPEFKVEPSWEDEQTLDGPTL